MKKTYYSNGKLLITGEYVVLDGAKAFALPTKFGQNLIVDKGISNTFQWTSFDSDGSIWFEDKFSFEDIIQKTEFGDNKIKTTLIEILHHAYLLNPDFIKSDSGYKITTELTFPKFWGLGTSSTLINNIAKWLEIDAFKLLKNSFGGSGYDIACAQNNSPIIYQLINGTPRITNVDFDPDFSEKLFFVYLNQKQNSRAAINNYYNKQGNIQKTIPIIDNITNTVIHSKDPKNFAVALQEHEIEMSAILESQTIQEALFSDFDGVIKSLGAWGGDFVLAISKENPTTYFKQKGYETVVPYNDIIL
ncbi:GYDIA family GHMP kinase [Flavobacterium terrae]|uniref:Mevalonate kinase n=1 Tax=Flavobacterium terrae TaxID=415425 RepID=A0A1M6BKT0_9FLAO|nr:GYDIA family GHMP kinase [Flavobacterium terrae]SHI49329.1 Mevalonate kinase [Flavobacterium terrae]